MIYQLRLFICIFFFCIFHVAYSQNKCDCPNNELVILSKTLNSSDSLEVFNVASQLKSSKENACIFLGLNLEFNYHINQKSSETANEIINEQENIFNASQCKANLSPQIKLNKAKYFRNLNQFESLTAFALEALRLSKEIKNEDLQIEALKELVYAFTRIDESKKRWQYVKEAEALILNNSDSYKSISNYIWLVSNYETEYTKTNRATLIDSGLVFIDIIKPKAKLKKDYRELTLIYRVLEAFSYHKGELDRALANIDTAIYYGKKIKGAKNLSGLYLSKAWDHYDLNEFEEVEKWTDTMLSMDTKVDFVGYMMTLSQAAELYEGAGNLNKANASLKKFITLKDSLKSLDRIKIINDLETKYQTELKNTQIKRLTILLTLAMLVILTLLFIGTLLRLRQSRKQNKALKIAFDKQIQLEKELSDVRDEIAQDFHDDLGNKLARISLLSNLVSGEVSIDDPKVKSKIKQITEDANGLYRGTRDFVFSLKSNSDYIEEIATYLSDFGEDFFEKTKVKFLVNKAISVNEKLPHYWNKQLIFIFKEALTNALKHSKCDLVSLSFTYKNNTLIINCTDNGIGISQDDMASTNGLSNMTYRAEKIGGFIQIDTVIGKGTSITFTGNITKNET